MTDKQRKNVVRRCKKNKEWIDGETAIAITAQNKIIKEVCESMGFGFHDFFDSESHIHAELLDWQNCKNPNFL